jgi:hypothetical protein
MVAWVRQVQYRRRHVRTNQEHESRASAAIFGHGTALLLRSAQPIPSLLSAFSHRRRLLAASASAFAKAPADRDALLHFVPVARDAARLRRRRGLCRKAAIGAARTTEEIMRALTIEELMLLTRVELTRLLAQIKSDLSELPDDSEDREAALTSLRNIRHVLLRTDLSPH